MIRSSLILMVGRAIGFMATFFVPVVLVRVLDQAQFGTYKQLFLVFGTLFPLAQLGMAESLYYFVPEGGRKIGRYVANAVVALALSGLAALLFLTLARTHVATWLNNPDLAANLPLVGVYLLLSLVAAALEVVLISRERYGFAAATFAISDVARALLVVVPVVLFGGLRWLMIGAVVFATLRVVATLVVLRAHLGAQLRPGRAALGEQISYSGPFQVSVIFETLAANAHFFAVAWFFDAPTYAIYAVGCLQIPLVGFIGSSVGNVLMVKLRAAAARSDTAQVLFLWKETTRRLALVFFPLTGLLLIGAHDLIALLFTPEYIASVPVFMIWAAFIVLSVADTDAALRTYAETRFLAVVNGVCLVVTVGLVAWAMPAFGLIGAVLATLTATVLGETLAVRRLGRILDVPTSRILPWNTLGRIGAIAGLAAVPALAVRGSLSLTHLEGLIVVGAVYSITYLAGVWFGNVIRKDEQRALVAPLLRLPLLSPRLAPVPED